MSRKTGLDRLNMKKSTPRHIHIMGKPESKMMRKLQAKTGLSEEEIRSHKKYNVLLSEAQTKRLEKLYKLVSKAIKQTNLPSTDPLTKLRIRDIVVDKLCEEFYGKSRTYEEWNHFYKEIRRSQDVTKIVDGYHNFILKNRK